MPSLPDAPLLDGLSILVADDQPPVCAAFKRSLPALGVRRPVIVSNGSQAVDAINTSDVTFDCVIADVYMAPGTGLQLLHVIRMAHLKQGRPDMCVILMSGQASTKIGKLAHDLDVNGFLAKPFTRQSLADAVIKARRRIFPLDLAKYKLVDPESLTPDAIEATISSMS